MAALHEIWLGTLAASAMSLACTEFAPGTDSQPTGAQQGLSPANWACLRDRTRTQAPSAPVLGDDVPRIVYSLRFVDLSTGVTYPDIRVRACGIADVDCQNPVQDFLPVDARGYVDIPLFEDFFGFLEISSPQILSSLLFLTEPLKPRLGPEFPYGVVSRASLDPLLRLLRVTLEPNSGIFAARAFDCDGNLASDVSYVGPGIPYYFVGRLPSQDVDATDPEGLGGFVNVPAGLAMIDALAPDGRSITGSQSIVIRDGWLSSFYASPPGTVRMNTP
jgi:hypothetical protein